MWQVWTNVCAAQRFAFKCGHCMALGVECMEIASTGQEGARLRGAHCTVSQLRHTKGTTKHHCTQLLCAAPTSGQPSQQCIARDHACFKAAQHQRPLWTFPTGPHTSQELVYVVATAATLLACRQDQAVINTPGGGLRLAAALPPAIHPSRQGLGESGECANLQQRREEVLRLAQDGPPGAGQAKISHPALFPTLSSPHLGGQGAPGHGAGLLHTPDVCVAAVQQTRQTTGTVLVHVGWAALCVDKQKQDTLCVSDGDAGGRALMPGHPHSPCVGCAGATIWERQRRGAGNVDWVEEQCSLCQCLRGQPMGKGRRH